MLLIRQSSMLSEDAPGLLSTRKLELALVRIEYYIYRIIYRIDTTRYAIHSSKWKCKVEHITLGLWDLVHMLHFTVFLCFSYGKQDIHFRINSTYGPGKTKINNAIFFIIIISLSYINCKCICSSVLLSLSDSFI